jgi:DNA-binding beta-propeller fold protein YncE
VEASALAVSADGRSVYSVSEIDDSLVRLKRNRQSGALTPKGCIIDDDVIDPGDCGPAAPGLGGGGSVAVSSDGKSVYVASEADGTIAEFKRNRKTGALTSKGCVIDDDGSGDDPCTKSTSGLGGATAVVVSPDGKSVYASSEGDSAIVRFKRNTTSGKLTPKDCVADIDEAAATCVQNTAGLGQVGALALSDDGTSLYATGEVGTVARFKRDPHGGELTPEGCIVDNDLVAPPACGKSTDGLDHTESLTVSHDGKSVYAVSTLDSAIVRFDRNTQSGALTPKGCIDDNDSGADACANDTNGLGEGAGVAVSRDGKSVYVVSGEDDAIVIFKRGGDGALTPKGCIDDNDFDTDPTQGEDNCAKSANGLAKLTGVVVSRDGKSVYATSEFDDAVAWFKRATG